jgi:Protein of unknown function (DUF1501)
MPTNFPHLTRREVFRLGALTVSGFRLLPFTPGNVRAAGRVQPRGSADCVIFLNLQGGPSQMDTFDVKEGKWGPENRDIRTTPQGFRFPYGLMPKLAGSLDDILLVRSMEAWETVHSRGQYYLQTGHAVSPARVKEMPSVGSIVAYEFEKRNSPGHFLPPFVSMNYAATTMYGPLQGEGCLPSNCSPLTLDLNDKNLPFLVKEEDQGAFHRRYQLLQELDSGAAKLTSNSSRQALQYDAFRKAVHRMMVEPRIAEVMRLTDEDRAAYGKTPLGDACIIARNMVEANAGARFIFVTQPGWDHHGNIYGKEGKGGIYKTCSDLDSAFSALMADLKRIKRSDGSSLLDRTLVVCMGEFGRTPGDLTPLNGREHYANAMVGAFAGAGIVGGRVMGSTDEQAAGIVDYGWSSKRPIYPEDVCATIYSALGIDWTKRITNTPSGRDFVYVDPAGPQKVINFREVTDFYG